MLGMLCTSGTLSGWDKRRIRLWSRFPSSKKKPDVVVCVGCSGPKVVNDVEALEIGHV